MPIIRKETAASVKELMTAALKPSARILEIGTAVGYSALADVPGDAGALPHYDY